MLELTVEGNIPVKKNRQRIGANGGIYRPKEVNEYEDLFGWEARIKRLEPVLGTFAIEGDFHIKESKDLDGVLTTVLDCLQKFGYIENDKYLRQIRMLTKFPVKRGDNERVTIRVIEYTGEGDAEHPSPEPPATDTHA